MVGKLPRVYRCEAVVLRQRRLGEADRILTLFTPQLGKVEAVAKGVRKQTSRKAGHLEPLTLSSLLVASGRSLDIITQAQTIESFVTLREDLQRLARGMYVAELVDRFTETRGENFPVFRLLVETLQRLAASPVDALDVAVRYFELHLLGHLGYRPQLSRCVACGGELTAVPNAFSPALGGVICTACRHTYAGTSLLSVTAQKVLRLLQRGEFEAAARLRISGELASELERTLRSCVRFTLEQNPRSLDFIDAIRHAEQRPALPRVAEGVPAYSGVGVEDTPVAR